MSRPQKIIPPIKGSFDSILTSVAMGSGVGKRSALKLAREKSPLQENIIKAPDQTSPSKKP